MGSVASETARIPTACDTSRASVTAAGPRRWPAVTAGAGRRSAVGRRRRGSAGSGRRA